MAQVISALVTTKLRDPWEVVDRARCLRAYDFEGSSKADVANKLLKKVIKVFELMKLTDVDKMHNVHGLLQGGSVKWFDGTCHRYGVGVT